MLKSHHFDPFLPQNCRINWKWKETNNIIHSQFCQRAPHQSQTPKQCIFLSCFPSPVNKNVKLETDRVMQQSKLCWELFWFLIACILPKKIISV